jgi:hypothetical protein
VYLENTQLGHILGSAKKQCEVRKENAENVLLTERLTSFARD